MNLPSNLTDRDVCVLGLGYVGLTLSVAMADRGFHVFGLEIRDDILELLSRGAPHFWEPRLAEKLQRVIADGRFEFSKNLAIPHPASVFLITVGTPLDADGKVRTDMVENAANQVADAMPDGALVILRSTVKLGTTREVVRPVLEKSGKSFDLAVCPERTLEGKALIELGQLPQIIGADDPNVRFRAMQIFSALTPTTIEVSSLEAAELVKLVDNTFRDVTFGFANEVAYLCTKMGLSATEVIQAGKLGYERTNVALPGPVGGPCLEKDPHILVESARAYEVEMAITSAARQTNQIQPERAVAEISSCWSRAPEASDRPRISLLGLAFKGIPPTDDLRGTMARPVFESLKKRFGGAHFSGFDAVVEDQQVRDFGLEPVESLEKAFKGTNIAVILNNHVTFQNMDLVNLASLMAKPAVIYDFWALHLDAAAGLPSGVSYLPIGGENHNPR